MYFNPDDVVKHDYLLNFIVSERGAGKTFSTLKYCVEKFLENGDQFVYCRRTDVEIDICYKSLLSPLQAEGYFPELVFDCRKDVILCDGVTMGRFVNISGANKLKSVAFPKVKYIIFDEFISETDRYLKNEVKMFLSVVETIGRMRDINIFCLANQITTYNPYYIYFGVQPAGEILTRFRAKSILIYQFKSTEYRTAKLETKFGKLISGTEYGSFMLDNSNIKDNYSFVDKLKGCKKTPIINIILEGKNIVVYDVIEDDSILLFFSIKESIDNIRTLNFDKQLSENATIESMRSHNISKRITTYIRRGDVRFNDLEVKKLIEGFIF